MFRPIWLILLVSLTANLVHASEVDVAHTFKCAEQVDVCQDCKGCGQEQESDKKKSECASDNCVCHHGSASALAILGETNQIHENEIKSFFPYPLIKMPNDFLSQVNRPPIA